MVHPPFLAQNSYFSKGAVENDRPGSFDSLASDIPVSNSGKRRQICRKEDYGLVLKNTIDANIVVDTVILVLCLSQQLESIYN